jgi:LysR family transcriptional regulator, low CO2-responsive transcriptional regulator
MSLSFIKTGPIMKNLTFKQLRAVAEVAHTGSVSQAAERLHLSPSAVSITIKLVEEEVGMPIFEKAESGFKPTSAGHELLIAEGRIAAALKETLEALDSIKGANRGRVTVGCVSTAKYFVPYALAGFRKLHPEAEIILKVGNREEILEQLEDFTLDIALTGRPPQSIEVQRAEVGPHPHVVIAAPDHAFARQRHVSAKSLSNETFLLREPGSGTRMLQERILSEIGATPKTGMEMSSNETIKQAVMAGLGIAFLSQHTVAHEVAEGRLCVLKVEGTPVIRKWYIVRLSEKPMMPLTSALWSFLHQNGTQYFPSMKPVRAEKQPNTGA